MITNLLIAVCLFFSTSAEASADHNRDRIKVIEVNYEGELNDGEEATFEVVVKYQLMSQENATIMIGFNNEKSVIQMKMMDEEFKVVKKGEGEVTFLLTTIVKDWGSEGDFQVHVNLAEYPLPQGRFSPKAADRFILIPEKW